MSDMPEHAYVYPARPVRVIDGDTVVVEISVGFGLTIGAGNESAHVRLLGIDCPERNESGWDAARTFTTVWMGNAASNGMTWPLLIATQRADNFGRYLGVIWDRLTGGCLNDDLLNVGHAVPYERTRP